VALTNTLPFYVTELIMVVKRFMIQAPGVNLKARLQPENTN